MSRLGLLAALIGGAALVVTGVSLARGGDDDRDARRFSAKLVGYEETPAAISTRGRGSVELRVGEAQIAFRLHYEGLEGPATTQAHIHFGQRHTTGGVSVFFCGGQGTIVPADVLGPAGQGIAGGELDELVAAIRAGAAYANVHTTTWPAGEIRGQLSGRGGKGDD
jgi:hypothetical protein